MTIDEACFYLMNMDRKYMEEGMSEALDMAIEALSCSEKPNKWIDAEVLDKIADEVNKLNKVGYEGEVYVPINAVFDILDKYKAESEDKK